jgi:single-strand selective monofunctional uracil DNA glycosylase
MALVGISRELCRTMKRLRFREPVTCVYNPLEYARAPHERYLEVYGSAPKEVVLIGMNPGPFGMVQTGVPFGDVGMVRDWLKINDRVHLPARQHPRRPVLGFSCARSEVSGARLWGWARQRFETPERFFERFFVANYCPLAFVEESGKNRTPDKLAAEEREPLLAACDEALRRLVTALRPRWVIGIGAFAEQSARRALADSDLQIGTILHPSPASPKANRGWAELAEKELFALGIGVSRLPNQRR